MELREEDWCALSGNNDNNGKIQGCRTLIRNHQIIYFKKMTALKRQLRVMQGKRTRPTFFFLNLDLNFIGNQLITGWRHSAFGRCLGILESRDASIHSLTLQVRPMK